MVSTFSKVAEALLITVCVISYVLPSMASDCPSLIQETVVGGDPAVVQVRVEDELEVPVANSRSFEVELDTMVGGAAGKTPGFQYCRTLCTNYLLLNPLEYIPTLISLISPFCKGMRQVYIPS